MPKAKLENLTANKDGWAILSITLNEDEKSRFRISPAEDQFELCIKKTQTDDYLQFNEQGFLWGKGEFYFKVRRSKKKEGDIALKISSRLTDNFTDNMFFFIVRGEHFAPGPMPAMTNRLSRRKDSDANRYLKYRDGRAFNEVGLDDEDDPEVERFVPPTGRLARHPDPTKGPGWGVLEIRSKQPLEGIESLGGDVPLRLATPAGFETIRAKILSASPNSLTLELPPEFTDNLPLEGDKFDVGLSTPIEGLRVDNEGLEKRPPPPEPEPEPEPEPPQEPPRGAIMADPENYGWARLTINAGSEANRLAPGTEDYQLQVRDPATDQKLSFQGEGFDWGQAEFYANAPFLSLNDGILALQVIPGIASRLDRDPVGITVRWEGGSLSEVGIETSMLPMMAPPPPPPPPPEAYAPPPEAFLPPPPLPVEPPKKGHKGLIIGLLLLLVILGLGGFGYWKYFMQPKATDEQAEAEPTEPEKPVETEEPGEEEEPVGGGTAQVTPPAPPEPPEPPVVEPEPGPVERPPEPGAPTAVERAEALITGGGSQRQLEDAYQEYSPKKDEDSVDATYRLVQALSKYDAKFKAKLGEYYDPLSQSPVPGYVTKNALTAYQNYQDAEKLGFQGAKEQKDTLVAWSRSPEAEGQPGIGELRRTSSQ
ncbi:MAG: hypothetical protein LBF40_11330 [Deltaproteobacteria bacterium]|jgi:hypothetical protein|nr:hypothetical protein [Deltaproteobacteria bacterium]